MGLSSPSGLSQPGTAAATLSVVAQGTTSTPLTAGTSFTGDWVDCVARGISTMVVGASTDAGVDGNVSIQFSQDGVNVGGFAGPWPFTASGSIGVPKSVIATARYARVVVNNTSASNQTALAVQTLARPGSAITIPTSRVAQSQSDYSDCLSVRDLTDVHLDESRGLHGGRTVIHKFGTNPDVAASAQECITDGGGQYTGFLTTAAAVRVKAGGSADDDASGSGARSVRVYGLDENWEEAYETIATAGASASTATTTTFIRVFRVWVLESGTYGGSNAAEMVIETSGGTEVARIRMVGSSTNNSGLGQTKMAIFTVPSGKVAFVRRLYANVESNKTGDVLFWQRQNADDGTAPVTAPRTYHTIQGLSGGETYAPVAPFGPFPAKTDLFVSGVGPSGGARISARMEVILVDEV